MNEFPLHLKVFPKTIYHKMLKKLYISKKEQKVENCVKKSDKKRKKEKKIGKKTGFKNKSCSVGGK